MTQSNFVQIGQRARSYGTAIMDVLPDGRTIGNDTKYSKTTSHHQSKARVRGCDIVVTDAPMGTQNLAEWYMSRQGKVSKEVSVEQFITETGHPEYFTGKFYEAK